MPEKPQVPAVKEKAKDAVKSIEFGPSMLVGVLIGAAFVALAPKVKAKFFAPKA